VEKLLLFIEAHQLKMQGFKVTAIDKKLEISRYKYLSMTLEEFMEWTSSLSSRSKKLAPYQDHILNWLKEHPDLSSAQVEDWLKERFPELHVGGSTVLSYVSHIRDMYHILKAVCFQLPVGQQMQVDFWEITVENLGRKEIKLYFITFVLSHSRYKYVVWLDRPFTMRDAIRCHEQAFQYIGGMPEEMVYDQDHLITVSENAGDIILTGEFQAYKHSIYASRISYGVPMIFEISPNTYTGVELAGATIQSHSIRTAWGWQNPY
jgi:transposase